MGNSCVTCSKNKNKPSSISKSTNYEESKVEKRETICNDLGLAISNDNILKYFEFKQIIGHGSFGNVRLSIRKHVSTAQKYAVKSIPKIKVKQNIDLLSSELKILMTVDHPNIIKLYEVYEDNKFIHLVMEHCSGGELFEKILDNGPFTELEASSIMYKLLHAINHLHSEKISHRDLKPENILYKSEAQNSDIKIIDFGLSSKFGEVEEQMHTVVGTPYYVAPEVLEKNYGPECDVWSLGVILYLLLAGKPPFSGDNNVEVFEKIKECHVIMEEDVWQSVSTDAKDLILKLMSKNPKERPTAAQAMEHSWFAKINMNTNERTVDRTVLRRLQRYKSGNKLRVELRRVLLKYLSPQDINSLTDLFRKLDKKHTGYVSIKEIQRAFKRMGIYMPTSEISNILHNTKSNDQIKYTDFLIATLDTKVLSNEETIWSAFKYFDHENTGHITYDDIKEAIQRAGKIISDAEIDAMLSEAGITINQIISFRDFQMLINSNLYTEPEVSNSRKCSIESYEGNRC